ncbi:MAG: hypothetical protein ACI89J_001676 [Hyphomicrobiaceae bacterium]|jgi:hypothetical protein
MRPSLNFNLRPFAAYLAAIMLAALCWQDATSAYAGNTPVAVPLPPLPEQKPLRKARPSEMRPSPIRPFANSSPVILRRQPLIRPSSKLGLGDEIATLHAIHTALSSVGDGGAFVWQRGNGLLTGLIRPTTSFKSNNGEICRHIIIRLNSKLYTREAEGIACRDTTGAWSLSG